MELLNKIKNLFSYDCSGFLIWKNPPTNRVKINERAGSKRTDGRFQVSVEKRLYLTARLIFLWHHGYLPHQVDHINRIKSDDRIDNLRDAKGFNNANRTKKIGTLSIYRGVTYDKQKHKWAARCREKHIGYFEKEKEAAEAYNIKAQEVFGEFAHLNSFKKHTKK